MAARGGLTVPDYDAAWIKSIEGKPFFEPAAEVEAAARAVEESRVKSAKPILSQRIQKAAGNGGLGSFGGPVNIGRSDGQREKLIPRRHLADTDGMAVFGLLGLLFTALGVMLVYFGVLHLVRKEAITGFYVRNIPGYDLSRRARYHEALWVCARHRRDGCRVAAVRVAGILASAPVPTPNPRPDVAILQKLMTVGGRERLEFLG